MPKFFLGGSPLDQTTLYSKLTDVFHDVFDDDEIVVTPQLKAGDVSGWDSLKHIRLILTIESAFGVRFSASEVVRLKNVGELASLIQCKVS
jgi:acyl carrier protein